ncbi:MAG: carboxypeptidase regulatory-like domain-containing protein [Acidobacteriota bacterium]|nr:MAG: carboxypeptidase regulatory-like domain-containing protein [Acidobacteriota bacterium]
MPWGAEGAFLEPDDLETYIPERSARDAGGVKGLRMLVHRRGWFRRSLAELTLVALVLGSQLTVAVAQGPSGTSAINGLLFWEQSGGPVTGATVYCVHLDTKQVFSADPSTAQGEYALSGLPFGYYDCAVSTPQALCLANRVVNLPAGEEVEISMVLGPPQPEDTEWWSADPDRRIAGLDQAPDSVCRIVEGRPKRAPTRSDLRTDATPGVRPTTTTARWLVPLLGAIGLTGLAAVADDDEKDQLDQGATPF